MSNIEEKVVGRFGEFGGQYIPETLMNEIHKLEEAYEHYKKDPEFVAELDKLNREGRLQRGDLMVLSAFGAGLCTGTALLAWNT